MKKFVSATALICITLLLLIESVGLAWLSDNGRNAIADITSNVRKSYFESGDGTKDLEYDEETNEILSGPYEIKRPIQLYYFAWLQYLGYFNMDLDNDGEIDTVYFRLSNDLAMSGVDEVTGEYYSYVLPPIGTVDNPFLGNFDGCGHTISNLTVENVHKALSDPPDDASEESFGGAEIIGFFGVIGELAEGDYQYNSLANEVKNVILENVTIKTETTRALIGIVAGYVNGTVDCVGVVGSQVDIKSGTQPLSYTENISDFSIIGYCTEEYKNSVYLMDVVLTAPQSSVISGTSGNGPGKGWGGSIAMQSIFSWLYDLKVNESDPVDFITSRSDKILLDGTTYQTITSSIGRTSTSTTSIDKFGTFVFADFSGDYNFMGGSTSVKEYHYSYYTDSENPPTVYVVTDGVNYVGLNGTTVTNVASADAATKWYIKSESTGSSIFTVIGNDVYFLTVTSGVLSVTSDVAPDNPPIWTDNQNGLFFGTRGIEYADGAWRTQSATYYYLSNGTNNNSNYLSLNANEDGITSTNKDSATGWELTSTTGNTTIGKTIENSDGTETTLYLGISGSALTLTETPTTWSYSNRRFSIRSGTTTYYLRYNRGWTLTNRSNSATNITITEAPDTTSNTMTDLYGTVEKGVTYTTREYIENQNENYYYDSNGVKQPNGENTVPGVTYFPLSSDVDITTDPDNKSYAVSSNNTGYIISSRYGDMEKGELNEQYGNIRISKYALVEGSEHRLENYQTPYAITYKSNGVVALTDQSDLSALGLQKYASCYSDFLDSIEDGSCYGLHFMRASVTMSNLVEVNVKLNDEDKPNYQMPTNCIDFNLYDAGFINFFAGSYYTIEDPDNNSCFSIYEIIRNDKEEITEIREINKIYAILDENDNIVKGDENPYRYTYTVYETDADGNVIKTEVGAEDIPTSSDLPLEERYQMVFDCAWITDSEASLGGDWVINSAYYFEVPVNAGEYAIGSTYNRTGAYLIYLDLAANVQQLERTREYEESTTNLSAKIPDGVEFLEEIKSEQETYDTSSIKSQNSAFVSINDGTSGEIAFDKNGDIITHSAKSGTTPVYISPNTTLKDGNGKEMSASATPITTVRRTTYRDLYLTTGKYTVTVITETETVTGNTTKTTYHKKVTTTTTNADGTTTTKTVEETSETEKLEPDVVDESLPNVETVPPLLNLAFSYGLKDSLVVTYELIPATTGENGETVAATYLVTIKNQSGEPVDVKALLTQEGVESDIVFVISDGNGKTTTLSKTSEAQKVTIDAQS